MGTAERKEREKIQRRNAILEAAEKIFFGKGFEDSTMDDVAEQAELSKGTLYLYFKSKEDLFSAIAKKGENILEELFREAVKNRKNGLNKVRAIGEAFVKFYTEYHEYHEAILYSHSKKEDTNGNTDVSENEKHESNSVFVEAIIEGISDGSIRPEIDPVMTSFLLWGQTMGVLMLIANQGNLICKVSKRSPEDLLKYFFDYTARALKATK